MSDANDCNEGLAALGALVLGAFGQALGANDRHQRGADRRGMSELRPHPRP